MSIKKYSISVVAIFAITIIATLAFSQEINDRVIAMVNNSVITMSDLVTEGGDDVVGDPNRMLANGKTVGETRDIVLEQIILKMLFNQTVEDYGISVSEKQINAAIENQMKMLGLDKQGFTASLAKENMTFTGYKKEVEYQLKKQLLIEQKFDKHILVTDEELNKYFSDHKAEYADLKEYRMSEIALPIPADASDATRDEVIKKAKDIRSALLKGADFTAMAKEYSAAPDAEKGGDMGFINPKDFDPNLLAFVRTLKVGEVSEVIPTSIAAFIFKITETRPISGGVTADLVRAEIESILRTKKNLLYFDQWLKEIRKNAFVTIMR